MKIKVSDIIAARFADWRMSHVFGISGAGNLHIFDSIAKRGESPRDGFDARFWSADKVDWMPSVKSK